MISILQHFAGHNEQILQRAQHVMGNGAAPIHTCGHEWGLGLPVPVLVVHKKCHQVQ